MTFVAGQAHVSYGRSVRNDGNLEDALAEFQRAVEIDPASTVASQESRRTIEMIEERERQKEEGRNRFG